MKNKSTFSYDRALDESISYFNGDELAGKVFLDKYALRDKEGNLLEDTPNAMHRRLAREFAIEAFKWVPNIKLSDSLSYHGQLFFKKIKKMTLKEIEDFIFGYFDKFNKIVPQGRVMAGLGVYDSFRSLSNCLRLPPPRDSYSSIMYSDSMLVSAAKRGCGYGLGISNLRPEGVSVKNSAQSSTGAVSFMHRYSFSTREVAQSGRRGACLIDIDVRHPNTDKFITIKQDRSKVTGANISVKYTDEFFQKLQEGKPFLQRFPIDTDISNIDIDVLDLDKLYEKDGVYIKKINPKKLFDLTVKSARDDAEPGLFFWDRMSNYDPVSVYKQFKIDGTNACGEQPMAVGDTCRLILINLFSFVKNPFTDTAFLSGDDLYDSSYMQLFLGDILVDLEIKYIDRILEKINSDKEPLEEKQIEINLWNLVRKIATEGRRVGCGITALADMIAAMNIKYDSEEALRFVEDIMRLKTKAELDASIDLSILRGSFIGWDKNLEYFINEKEIVGRTEFYSYLKNEFPDQVSRMICNGRRNVNWSTIAPAGSVSVLTQSSSGCEPLFMPHYTRRVKINPNDENHKVDFVDQSGDSWRNEIVVHEKIKQVLISKGLDINEENITKTYKDLAYNGCTANEINWLYRIKMQAVLQKYTTSAISTTLNLPSDVTEETVYNIYLESWKLGLKGQTIYRDGCRTGVLIKDEKKSDKINKTVAPKRPKELPCDIYHVKVSKKLDKLRTFDYMVLIGLLDGDPYEVFAVENGKYDKKLTTGKLIKKHTGHYNLTFDNSDIIIENLTKDTTESEDALTRMISTSLRHGADVQFVAEQLNKVEGELLAFSKGISRALKRYIKDGSKSSSKCECGGNLTYQEGCQICTSCGSSKCG
jgi:ribonucleoside-diphosphate reductase alpha chain